MTAKKLESDGVRPPVAYKKTVREVAREVQLTTALDVMKLALNFDDKWRSLSRYSSLAD
jgi:hypothetical protein